MTDKNPGSTWKSFKERFPWKDMFLGFLIPKVFFLYGAQMPQEILRSVYYGKACNLKIVGLLVLEK